MRNLHSSGYSQQKGTQSERRKVNIDLNMRIVNEKPQPERIKSRHVTTTTEQTQTSVLVNMGMRSKDLAGILPLSAKHGGGSDSAALLLQRESEEWSKRLEVRGLLTATHAASQQSFILAAAAKHRFSVNSPEPINVISQYANNNNSQSEQRLRAQEQSIRQLALEAKKMREVAEQIKSANRQLQEEYKLQLVQKDNVIAHLKRVIALKKIPLLQLPEHQNTASILDKGQTTSPQSVKLIINSKQMGSAPVLRNTGRVQNELQRAQDDLNAHRQLNSQSKGFSSINPTAQKFYLPASNFTNNSNLEACTDTKNDRSDSLIRLATPRNQASGMGNAISSVHEIISTALRSKTPRFVLASPRSVATPSSSLSNRASPIKSNVIVAQKQQQQVNANFYACQNSPYDVIQERDELAAGATSLQASPHHGFEVQKDSNLSKDKYQFQKEQNTSVDTVLKLQKTHSMFRAIENKLKKVLGQYKTQAKYGGTQKLAPTEADSSN